MRINVDGSALRDPRVLRLAKSTGADRHQTLGRLLDAWALCYDRVRDVLPAIDVDSVTECDGFAAAMVAAGLADIVSKGRDDIRIRGADRRIAYLQGQAERGRSGGLARRKQTLSKGQAAAKPSGSGSAPDLDPDHDLDLAGVAPAKPAAQPSKPRKRTPTAMPPDFAPTDAHRAFAAAKGLDLDREAERFRLHHEAKGSAFLSWSAALSTWLHNAVDFARPSARQSTAAPVFKLVTDEEFR